MRSVVSLCARYIGVLGPKGLFGLGVAVLAMLYVGIFVLPQPVTFAYAGKTCAQRITLFPSLHRTTLGNVFEQGYEGGISFGSHAVISTKTCFTPAVAPTQGNARVSNALFGIRVFESNYSVYVESAPKVVGAVHVGQLALTKPLELAMSKADETFEYHTKVDDKLQRCTTVSTKLACKLDQLGLKQGNEYAVRLERSFNGQAIDAVAETKLRILPAVQVVSSTIRPGETVYTRPLSATVVTNKQLLSATASLTQVGSSAETAAPITVHADGASIALSWGAELPREKAFRLVLKDVRATDGSTLAEPYVINFTTSGGPKVLGVNIGAGGVAPGARVVVSFDQPLAPRFNIAALAASTGIGSVVSIRGNQVVYTLGGGVAPCTPFTLNISRGLPSASGLVGASDWSHQSRISCRRTAVIGKSVNGRAIVAYYYGTGSQSVLFTGGIHGSEPSGTYLMQDWAKHLDTYAYKIPAGRQVVIVSSVNPDGIATNNRYNAHGVNLARNFPSSDWSTDIDTAEGVKPGGGGSAPLSEPEAQALANLTSSLRLRLMVSFHAKGGLVGINGNADSRAIGSMYASAVGYQTMFDNAEQIMGYSFTGEYETWIGETLGAPAVLVELPTYSGKYFIRHQNILWKMVGV